MRRKRWGRERRDRKKLGGRKNEGVTTHYNTAYSIENRRLADRNDRKLKVAKDSFEPSAEKVKKWDKTQPTDEPVSWRNLCPATIFSFLS
jgi:hypothetical protein